MLQDHLSLSMHIMQSTSVRTHLVQGGHDDVAAAAQRFYIHVQGGDHLSRHALHMQRQQCDK